MATNWTELVWSHGPARQADLVVLLAIADRANRTTGICFPSVEDIAERSRLKVRNTQKRIRSLEADGWLEVVYGGGKHATNRYRIRPERFQQAPAGQPASVGWPPPNPVDRAPNPVAGDRVTAPPNPVANPVAGDSNPVAGDSNPVAGDTRNRLEPRASSKSKSVRPSLGDHRVGGAPAPTDGPTSTANPAGDAGPDELMAELIARAVQAAPDEPELTELAARVAAAGFPVPNTARVRASWQTARSNGHTLTSLVDGLRHHHRPDRIRMPSGTVAALSQVAGQPPMPTRRSNGERSCGHPIRIFTCDNCVRDHELNAA